MRKIIHIDMDAFYASVEQRDEPRYRDKPIVVGGSPEKRGAVAAASYEARTFGIHSAMPSRTAQQKCPELIFVKPRFDVYRAVSEQIRDIFFRFTDLVEPLSLDEAYLDVTQNKPQMASATAIAQEIRQLIFAETHLTASAGVSTNKFLAKVASGLNKPNGIFVILPEAAEAFVEQLPIEKFHGIGEVTAQKMHQLGIFTGADLKQWSEFDLVQQFGKVGRHYYKIARGLDDRPVEPNRVRKSVGAEITFEHDLSDREQMKRELESIASDVQERLKKKQVCGRTLTLKIKFANYQQITRSRTSNEAFCDRTVILAIATDLLEKTDLQQRKVRLLGISLSNLEAAIERRSYTQLTLPNCDFIATE